MKEPFTATWHALSREAAIAAEHMARGVTALGQADYARHAYYGEAFFALSTGFERAAKLAILLDYAIQHNGSSKEVSGYGHDLASLTEDADLIAQDLATERVLRLPRTETHAAIIETLTKFSTNITRYYNLDLLTGRPKTSSDAIARWHTAVTQKVLTSHYSSTRRARDEAEARALDDMVGAFTRVMFFSETGTLIDSVYASALHSKATAVARRWERMYVMQLARFLGRLVSELGYAAHRQGLPHVPFLSEFFAIFHNDDAYFRSRKTWSIYRS